MSYRLRQAWQQRGVLACLLWPASLLYGGLRWLVLSPLQMGWRKAKRLPVPVIVVGNVLAGGAGKTPVVMALLEHLTAKGVRAGVISRGHGRQLKDCIEVSEHSTAAEVGDEPLLIHRRCRVPVMVGAQRAQAGEHLLHSHPRVQVLVCDDGLQHAALHRDIDICVFDDRGLGNGWLLPAGPLREPWPRKVDMVICSQAELCATEGISEGGMAAFSVRRSLQPLLHNAHGETCTLQSLAQGPVMAVAGIARPEMFFAMLGHAGVRVQTQLPLPDHHPFNEPLTVPDGTSLVCTEKDAVKIWMHHPAAWAVRLDTSLEPAALAHLDALLAPLLRAPPGGTAGAPTKAP